MKTNWMKNDFKTSYNPRFRGIIFLLHYTTYWICSKNNLYVLMLLSVKNERNIAWSLTIWVLKVSVHLSWTKLRAKHSIRVVSRTVILGSCHVKVFTASRRASGLAKKCQNWPILYSLHIRYWFSLCMFLPYSE